MRRQSLLYHCDTVSERHFRRHCDACRSSSWRSVWLIVQHTMRSEQFVAGLKTRSVEDKSYLNLSMSTFFHRCPMTSSVPVVFAAFMTIWPVIRKLSDRSGGSTLTWIDVELRVINTCSVWPLLWAGPVVCWTISKSRDRFNVLVLRGARCTRVSSTGLSGAAHATVHSVTSTNSLTKVELGGNEFGRWIVTIVCSTKEVCT